MTEAQWLACDDSLTLLDFLRGKVSDRKFRLFALVCCRRLTPFMPRGRKNWFPGAVSAAEQLVERDGNLAEMSSLRDQVIPFDRHEDAIRGVTDPDAHAGARESARAVAQLASLASGEWRTRGERLVQARRLRDIVGNPFCPVNADSAWLTSTVVALAREMYDSRDFSAMPILADALQDAGCENAGVLDHCRDPKAVHVRGCWVVDLLLGKV